MKVLKCVCCGGEFVVERPRPGGARARSVTTCHKCRAARARDSESVERAVDMLFNHLIKAGYWKDTVLPSEWDWID